MSAAERVWIVDDDQSIRWVLSRALEAADMQVTAFETAESLLDRLTGERPDAIVTDLRMPGMSGVSLLENIGSVEPQVPVIIMTAYSDLDSAVSAYRAGAFEYLPKPFDVDDAVQLVRRAIKNRSVDALPAVESTRRGAEILGKAPAMQEVFRAVGRLSRSHISVLITGETGTGKELVARALHENGPRRAGPFIALNTAAIPSELLESELFGHERGAFTGADAKRRGRFQQAHGGTLFLDEIGDMPAPLQTRLLRVLSDGEFYSVGGHTPFKVDVRIIAATHQPLEDKVKQGQFREDLYHRLNVIRVRVPALRERRDDIPELASHFMQIAGVELDTEPKQLSAQVVDHLSSLEWPGNVRQLENTCRWLTVMAPGQRVRLDDLPEDLSALRVEPSQPDWVVELLRWTERSLAGDKPESLEEARTEFERTLITAALKKTHGRRQAAAKLLGWGRNTLTRKMRSLSID